VTAKTLDGKEVYKTEKIHMPVPQQFGIGEKMGRGPYEKSGILRDTSLPPGKMVVEKFDIPLYKEEKVDGKLVRSPIAYEFDVDVELWYLPYGKKDDPGNAVMWNKFTKRITVPKGGK
jgi:hypothetical protein